MNGYVRLWAADPDGWSAAGVAWQRLDVLVARRAGELSGAAAGLRAAWSGAAGRAADGRVAGLGRDLRAVLPALIEVDQVLAEFAAQLVRAKAVLAGAVARADRAGLLVDRQGRVSVDPTPPRSPWAPGIAGGPRLRTPPAGPAGGSGGRGGVGAWRGPAGPAAADVTAVAAGIGAALALAETADREATARLDELARGAGTRWAEPPPPGRPPPGAPPAVVGRWWAGLTPAQRRWLVGREPALVGRLDGVPAAARDQANRLLLDGLRAELLARRRRLLAEVRGNRAALAGVARVDADLARLAALTDRLARPGAPRAYLLRLDTAGDGRAVVALGDPDRARHVLTYVPGMTADLADADAELGRAERVVARCAALDPARETAAVLWLDYDAPDFLGEAARDDQARAAGAGLHRFQEGLRVTHEGEPARQTVLGHSYGSLVVGGAARDHGLAADALVFVGSPGVGVDHAGALRLPPDAVWSSTAPDDVIRFVRPLDELAGRAAVGPLLPALAGDLVGRPDDELWFGRNPSDATFGARVLPSDRSGHTGYWDGDNPALDGMARIVLGR